VSYDPTISGKISNLVSLLAINEFVLSVIRLLQSLILLHHGFVAAWIRNGLAFRHKSKLIGRIL